MSVTLVIGGQWGDEGKAKIIDFLARDMNYVVRYQGGANAGHTVVVGNERFAFHLVPSGILYPGVKCILGGGMVIDPIALCCEIEFLESRGMEVRKRIFVSEQAHLVLPHHVLMDRGMEEKRGRECIGTTKKGITPAYVDKVAREGMRMAEFLSPAGEFASKMEAKIREENRRLRLQGFRTVSPSKTARDLMTARRKIRPLISDTRLMLWDAIERGEPILCEGAQGSLLDIDHGTYPYVTSSSPTAGGAAVGAGIPPGAFQRIIVVLKAYCTRVGNGPFPTELRGMMGDRLRDLGQEYGTTTGRPRRCGWFDAVAAKTAVKLNGATEVALTKLDVLDTFDEIKICTAYRVGKRRIDYFPTDSGAVSKCRPQYKTLEGWKTPTIGMASGQLPKNAYRYVRFLEECVGCEVRMVSLGPERNSMIHEREDLPV